MPIRANFTVNRNADAGTWIAIGLIFVAILLLSMSISGAVVYAGWNYVAVPVFSAPAITFKQALLVGLVIGLFRGARGASK